MNEELAPVVMFVYRRLDHTRRTVESLLLNELSSETDLIVYSDGARSLDDDAVVNEVRKYLSGVAGFKSVLLRNREKNLGLAKNIIQGVSEVVGERGKVIVLEDDMVTSSHFLKFMNDALNEYAEDERVASIHGYVYPVTSTLPEIFFLAGADCWGWATWSRGWAIFNPDGTYLLDELKNKKLMRRFDFDGTYPYTQMLKDQVQGRNSSWAIRWYASVFLAGKFTLYPGVSLIHNIGNDESGTHCANTSHHDVAVSSKSLRVGGIDVEDSSVARKAFEVFFKTGRVSVFSRLQRRLRNFLNS
jgi:hypothetical protein